MKTINPTILLLILLLLFATHLPAQINVGGVSVPKLGNKKSKAESTTPVSDSNTNGSGATASSPAKEQKPKYSDEQKKALLDKANFPQYAADSSFVKTINRKVYDNKMRLTFEFFDKDSIVINECLKTKARLDSMKLTYTDRWAVQKEMNIYSDLQQNYDKAAKSITDLDYTIKNYSNTAAANSRKTFLEVITSASQYKTEGKIFDAYGKDRFKDLYAKMNFTKTYLYTLKITKGEKDTSYINTLKDQNIAFEKLNTIYGELEYQVLEKEPSPIEKYKGSDKEKHRAEIIKTWNASINPPRCEIGKVVKVYFLEDQWNNKTGIDWDNGGKNYDNSFLNVAIVTQDLKNAKKANVYYSYVLKDNLNGGKLDYDYCSCGAQLKYSTLMSKIKTGTL